MDKKNKLLLIISSILGFLIITALIITLVVRANRANLDNSLSLGYSYGDYYTPSYDGLLGSEMAKSSVTEDSTVQESSEDKIMKTGSVSVEVRDIPESLTSVRTLVGKYGGKVVSETDSGDGRDRSVYMTIRVDEDKYLDVYNELKELDGKLLNSSSNEEDVTQEYVDLQARLKNLQNTEEQLTEILNTAETVEDTLAVYTQLSNIRGQIESLQANIKYLDEKTDYSTISLAISQSLTGINVDEDKWEPVGIFKEAVSALVGFVKGLGSVAIWVLVFSPIIVIPVFVFVTLKKKLKK
jgi:hypothetical protein